MVPSYDRFFSPILDALARGPAGVPQLAERAADALGLGDEARGETIAYDAEPVVHARTRLAVADLRRAGLVVEEGSELALTSQGREAAGAALDRAALEQFPAYAAYRERFLARRGA